jgi:hypothetical protein
MEIWLIIVNTINNIPYTPILLFKLNTIDV